MLLVDRSSEILDAIARELKRIELRRELFTGIVLTGGGSLLHGMAEMTEHKLRMPVRIGIPDMLTSSRGRESRGFCIQPRPACSFVPGNARNKSIFGLNQNKPNERKKSGFEKFRDWSAGRQQKLIVLSL